MKNNEQKIGIGVDIGGSHISCCVVNLRSGKPLPNTQFESKVNNKASKEEIFQTWASPINQAIKALNGTPIAGIGFAMPGAFNYKKCIALFEGNDKYEKLYHVNVKEEFPPYLSVKNIELRFINDASAFAVGTAWFGNAKGYKKSIALTLGTGFGASFIQEEVPVIQGPDVPLHGSLWHLPFKDGIADDYFSTRWFVNAYEKLTNQNLPGVKEVAQKAQENEMVRQIFVEFGKNLAEFLMPWLQKFKPGILVIGGNISRSWNLIEGSFQQSLTKNHLTVHVATSNLMEEAALIGGAKLLDETFWNKVKNDLPEK